MAVMKSRGKNPFRLAAEELEKKRPALTDLAQHPGFLFLTELVEQYESQAAAEILDGEGEDHPIEWLRGHRACARGIMNALGLISSLRPLGEGKDKKTAKKKRGAFERGLLHQSGSGPGARD